MTGILCVPLDVSSTSQPLPPSPLYIKTISRIDYSSGVK